MGGAFIVLKGYACWNFTLKSNPLTLLNLYTINSPSRSFYRANGEDSLPFHILQLVKASPLSWSLLEGPSWVVYLPTYRSHEGCYSWVLYRKTQPLHRTQKISWCPFSKVAMLRSSPNMCGCATWTEVPWSLQLTSPGEEKLVGHGNALCARSGFLMFLWAKKCSSILLCREMFFPLHNGKAVCHCLSFYVPWSLYITYR